MDRADHLGKPVAAPRCILCIGGAAIAARAMPSPRWRFCLEGTSLRQAVEFGMACAQGALSSPRSIPEEFDRNEAERRQGIVAEANGG